ncbi:MAG TPA: hypothetical protein PK191_04695 [Niabella sp.]|nr:hypothetical protein [Niabella sp.]HOZ95902.1 hypothetical protein [Niabella sp.]HQW15814.1 hypothetical protein [Niabella sp.]HQX20954.1 hypothetical protein [Niabella sp.]HQX41256.1 hypothetical protein [Niabella sp.]
MFKLIVLLFSTIFLISCSSHKENIVKVIETPAGDSSLVPFLFTDKKGSLHFSWIEKNGKSATLNHSRYENKKWSGANKIASGENWFVNWADFPSICSDGKNNLIAHYLEKSDSGKFTYDVKYVLSSDNGKIWSAPQILNKDGKLAEHGFVSIKPYKENYFVSWLDGRNTVTDHSHAGHAMHQGEMTLRAAIIKKDGTMLDEWPLDHRVCDCCQTSVAITDNGPVVVYRDRSANEIRDIYIVRWENGKWTTPKAIFDDGWKIEGCPVNGPQIDAKENHLAIAWFTTKNKEPEVKIIFSNDGGATMSNAIKVNEDNPLGRVAIKMMDKKSAMITWMEGNAIKAMQVNKDGSKEKPVLVASSSESRSAGFPQMAKLGNKFIFAWTDAKTHKIKMAEMER